MDKLELLSIEKSNPEYKLQYIGGIGLFYYDTYGFVGLSYAHFRCLFKEVL